MHISVGAEKSVSSAPDDIDETSILKIEEGDVVLGLRGKTSVGTRTGQRIVTIASFIIAS